MRTIWIIFTCVVMSNFLKAAQDSEPVSSHLPPASAGSSYSVCPDSVFIPCSLLEEYPWDMSDLTKPPCSVDSIVSTASVLTDTAQVKLPSEKWQCASYLWFPYNRAHRL